MIGLFAAISAALAVAAGAFGAHGAAGPQEADWLRTGGLSGCTGTGGDSKWIAGFCGGA